MSRYPITVGIVCLARHTYDVAAALALYKEAVEDLKLMEDVNWVIYEEAVVTKEDAKLSGILFQREGADGVVIISGTFHLGHLALVIDAIVKKPLLLWAFNELPYNGGKIRLNSICGLNLNASNLYKAGNDTLHYTVGNTIDKNWLDALRMKAVLEKSHIGLAGFRADGFFTLGIDELNNYKETGLLLDHYELEEMYIQEVSEEKTAYYREIINNTFTYKELKEEQVKQVARLCASTEQFLEKHSLDALAVRCWPEFAASYGVAPCAMMSILQSFGKILSCEGDIEGAMSMLAAQAIGADTPFLADLSQVNFEEDYALMWHCGVAPINLWDQKSDRSLDTYFAGGKGVTAGFVLKTGSINVLRFDSARGKIRVFIGRGEVYPMEKQLTGTYAKVKYESNIKKVLDTIITTGMAHHIVLIYGEYLESIKIFAKIMRWEIIEL